MRSVRIDRRTFLAAGAAATAAAAVRPSHAAAAAAPQLGIQIYSLRGFPVDAALGHVRDLGIKAVEFYPGMFPVTDDAAAIEAMRQKVAALGLTISGHGVHRVTADPAAGRKLFTFAKAAGIRTITADPDPDSFDLLDGLVREFDVRIAIHNHGPRHRYNKAADVLAAIERRDPRIGACADLGHFIRSGERPVDVIRLLAGRLYGVHLKDFAEMQDTTRGVILGTGHFDVPGAFAALAQAGFPADGALSIEYEENEKDPVADLRACVAAARAGLAAAYPGS